LGVFHLAGKVVDHFADHMSPREQQLVKLAALLHDIGHGPFSHVYDDIGTKSHEVYGIEIVRVLGKRFGLTDDEISRVAHMIKGTVGPGPPFIYEIVSNVFDVDKLDYVIRDATSIGFTFNIDINRIIRYMSVKDHHIHFHTKIYDDVYEVFRTRYMLHKKVYQHPTVVSIEYMFHDMMVELATAPHETDGDVETSGHPLMRRILTRSIYKCTYRTISKTALYGKESNGEKKIISQRRIGLSGHVDHPMTALKWVGDQVRSTLFNQPHSEYWIKRIEK
jgi:HD superfamily phosphohydrolase